MSKPARAEIALGDEPGEHDQVAARRKLQLNAVARHEQVG